MFLSIEVAGHPRDMGLAQGRALAPAIRERVARAGLATRRSRWPSLGAFTGDGLRGSGVGRETIRHFTHLSERMDGLARGAGVPVDSILALEAGTKALSSGDVEARAAVALLAAGLEDAPGATLARSLSGSTEAGSSWVVRRSRPEVGFESVEITLPWAASSFAGLNDRGLSACAVPGPAPAAEPASAPSPQLLVQECVQRFAAVDAGVEWCLNRPVFGHGQILLADADGARALVTFEGSERRVIEPGEEAVAAGQPEALANALSEAARSARVLDEKAICPPEDAHGSPAWVRLIPTRRSLELRRPSGPREELVVEI